MSDQTSQQHNKSYDLCVIGGGINGAGIARDAAGRGLSVALIEAKDLAAATSSASTKLIHGGLRYLEYYEFKLVRDALIERENLLGIAPHIIWPMRFILPHDQTMRPKWMIRLGLFLYDNLAKRQKLCRSNALKLAKFPTRDHLKKGFAYSDCWVEDSRLVTLNAMSAKDMGADIMTYTQCTSLKEQNGTWHISLQETLGQQNSKTIQAKTVINAAGPWVKSLLQDNSLDTPRIPNMRLVKGSHIIVPKLYEDPHAFILQQPDGRIVFTIPYEYNYTLIGTTEEAYETDPYKAEISENEIKYLQNAVKNAFDVTEEQITPIHTYSGVRALFEDGSKDTKSVTRYYRLHKHKSTNAALLSIFGGKITTYRVLARKAVDMMFGTSERSDWTKTVALPGGDIEDFDVFATVQQNKYKHIDRNLIYRYARAYGTSMNAFINNDLGQHYGDDIYEAEINYVIQNEHVKTAEDFLWRRSKRGLHISNETRENIEKRFQS